MPKYSKRITQSLDALIALEESGEYYMELQQLASSLNLSTEAARAIVESMVIEGLVRWAGPSDRHNFALNEKGRAYKEINRLEIAEALRERLIGGVAGLILGLIAGAGRELIAAIASLLYV